MEFLIVLAILPSIVIGILIYKADRVEKEPKKELLKAFLLGCISVVLTLIFSFIFNVDTSNINDANFLDIVLFSFVSIAFIEEFSKWLCTYLFLKNNRNFNYLFDGIVYAVFVALGFATIENILYTLIGGISTVIVRAITTVPAHTFFGIMSGYYLSLSRNERVRNNSFLAKKYMFLSLFIPVMLHGFYDFCLLMQNMILLCVYLMFVVILYSIAIYHVKKMMEIDRPFSEKKIKFCRNCGYQINGKYCSNCGRKIE